MKYTHLYQNKLNTENQIKWLQRFLDIWEAQGSDEHVNWLSNIFERFCNNNNLPHYSADELIYELKGI